MELPRNRRQELLSESAAQKSPSRLVYVDIKTGKVHEILPGDVSGPCFSPDGQNIAFVYKDMIHVAPRHDIETRRELVAQRPGRTATPELVK